MVRCRVALVITVVPLSMGCSIRNEAERLVPDADSTTGLAANSADIVWHYVIDPRSGVHVDMPGLKERITGDTTAAAGSLDIVPKDLARSRGDVQIDLSTFSTHTFGNEHDAMQTQHARTWLEVQSGDRVREDMRWAAFSIRAIDGLSSADLTRVTPTREGMEDVRRCAMTVHGQVLVHGHTVPKDDVVDVLFRYPSGAPADSKPRRITIRSKEPLHLVLKEHDVRPRDPAGQVLEWTARLVSKVAETADVSVDLGAAPAL